MSTTRLLYPNDEPRSVIRMRWVPALATFSTAWRTSQGDRNWPFLMLTAARERPASTSRSVWRGRNAGIWMTSHTSAAGATWLGSVPCDKAGHEIESVPTKNSKNQVENEKLKGKNSSCRTRTRRPVLGNACSGVLGLPFCSGRSFAQHRYQLA